MGKKYKFLLVMFLTMMKRIYQIILYDMLFIKLNNYGQHGPKVGHLMYDIIEVSQDG